MVPSSICPPAAAISSDPSRYPFLETYQAADESSAIPRISDGVLYRVFENLLILDGERLSYRNLDVEQIGSVYEAVMGFTLEVAAGPAIAITSPKKAKGGAPVTINLEELLRATPAKRGEWLQKSTGQKLAPKAATALKGPPLRSRTCWLRLTAKSRRT